MKQKLLDILVCPTCFNKLEYQKDNRTLYCKADNLIYEVKGEIPVLINPAPAGDAKPSNNELSQ